MAEKITGHENSTQQFVEIDEIKNGVVLLKNGGIRAVVMVSGTNFELKSEEEQNAIIFGYQNFLNSLDFSVQIIIHSRKINIENYLKKMEALKEKEEVDLLKDQITEYISFIKGFVKENEIMTKNFFVVIPYESVSVSDLKKSVVNFLPFISKKKNKKEEQQTFDQKVSQLQQRVDQVVSGLESVGLRAVVLNDEELLEIYYNLYNPETVERELTNRPKDKDAQ